ncbi:MAG: DUF1700 domain-containing protein [Oscillospiraceae bacterium]|nr:DUF1700 domain-containing protein [Oscillospiraceae bacterium]
MNRETFLAALCGCLSALNEAERAQVVSYYEELIDDAVENGGSEEEVLSSFDAPEAIARQILKEYGNTAPTPGPDGPNCYKPLAPGHAVHVEAHNIRVVVRAAAISVPRILFTPYRSDIVTTEERDGVFYFYHRSKIFSWSWLDLLRGPHEIVVELPHDFAGELFIKTSNAAVRAEGLSKLAEGSFTSQNGKVLLENITCRKLFARSGNAGIVLTNVTGDTVSAVTSNARITATACSIGQSCSLTTSNAALRLEDISCPCLSLKTSNAAVTGTVVGDVRDYAIRSHTSNASNNLPPEFVFPEQTRSLTVKTSNARINLQFIPSPGAPTL